MGPASRPVCSFAIKTNPTTCVIRCLFINADREYAEGKNQNKLRPEDVEKIDFVFTHKREIPKYSRLVDKPEIADKHDYNLNIRRYVDNTPEPEPEDVQAHLIGGIPETEVTAQSGNFAKFGLQCETLFQPDRPRYLDIQGVDCKQGRYQRDHRSGPIGSRTRSIPTATLWNSGGAWPVTTLPSLNAPITAVGKCRKYGTSC